MRKQNDRVVVGGGGGAASGLNDTRLMETFRLWSREKKKIRRKFFLRCSKVSRRRRDVTAKLSYRCF